MAANIVLIELNFVIYGQAEKHIIWVDYSSLKSAVLLCSQWLKRILVDQNKTHA